MSIASQIIQEAGKRNRSRDWYRSMLMTALQNYRGELYMNGSNPEALNKVNNLVQNIEDEMESK